MKNKSISGIQKNFRSKKISPVEFIQEHFKEAKRINQNLNIYITLCEKEAIDKAKKIESFDKPLTGIPFSMKDTFSTKAIKTTAGSKLLNNYYPPFNATVYKRLVDAGAILVGKANCDAWGHGSSTENSDFGPTKNPWNVDYVPGGSSGGSAAAVAAGTDVFGIGEDTGGSIRLPASFCSVPGLKVTYGRVSRYGCIAFASSLDTVGPFANSIADLALIMEIIAGKDPYDATTIYSSVPKYTQLLDQSLSGLTIGIPEEYFTTGIDKQVEKKINEVIKAFEEIGCKFKKVSLPSTKYAVSIYYLIATSETSSNLARYDGIRFGKSRDSFSAEAKRRMSLGTFTLSTGYYDAYYLRAARARTKIKQEFEQVFKEVDMIIAPVSPTPAFKLGEKINDPLQMYLSDILTIPTSLAGLPALSLPAGFSKNNLPVGFQIIGKQFNEAQLLNLGYLYEKSIGGFVNMNNQKKTELSI